MLNKDNRLHFIMKYDWFIVLGFALVTGLIWYFNEPIIFTYDSFAYLNSAKALSGVEDGSYVYFRAPFLPLLLSLTGVPKIQSFSYFIGSQLILGVGIIWVLYACLKRISSFIGFIAILLFISSFAAFIHSKSIMTEEIYLLGWCLCIDGSLGYLKSGNRFRLVEITIALLILSMTRAQGAFIAFIILPFIACIKPKKWLEISIAAMVLICITLCYGFLQSQKASLIDQSKTITTVSKLSVTNTTGKMLFMVVYWDPFRRMDWVTVRPENGPASKRLFSELKEYYSNPKHLHSKMDYELFGRFEGHPEALTQTIENKPDGQYWWAIWRALDAKLGAGVADQLLLNVTIETILKHPFKIATIYLRNFFVSLVTADTTHVWAHRSFGTDFSLNPVLVSEMIKSGDSATHTRLAKFINFYFPKIQFLILALSLLTLPFIWRSSWKSQWFICLLLLIYNHTTIAIAASPESRYTFYAFPILLTMLTMGLRQFNHYIPVQLKQRKTIKFSASSPEVAI